MVLSKSYVLPCSNRQSPMEPGSSSKTCAWFSIKPSYAYDTKLPVQCMAKYMIDCNITKVSRCIYLQTSPAHIITCTTTCKNLCYCPWKERQARLLCKVAHCTGGFPANTRPWMDFHQWQHLLHGEWSAAAACTLLHRPAHVSHDSGHPWLVWVVRMYTRFATLLLAFLIPLPSQCNTLKPVLLVWFPHIYNT